MKRFVMVLAAMIAAVPAAALADSVTMTIPAEGTLPSGGFADEGASSGGIEQYGIQDGQVTGEHLALAAEIEFLSDSSKDWFFQDFAVSATGPYTINIVDDPASIEVIDVGYFLSPTQIPLEDLNFDTNSPPGSGGSLFTPLPSLDNAELSEAGGLSESTTITPLPSAAGMGYAAIGFLGISGLLRKKLRPA